MVAAFFLAAHAFIVVLAGTAHLAAVNPFQTHALRLAQRVARLGATLQTHTDNGAALRITLWTVRVHVPLSMPMTLPFGIAGRTAGSSLANRVAFLLDLLCFRTYLRSTLAEAFSWRIWLRTFSSAMASGGVLAVLRWGPGADLPSSPGSCLSCISPQPSSSWWPPCYAG